VPLALVRPMTQVLADFGAGDSRGGVSVPNSQMGVAAPAHP
jgi:hypothetical protein